MLFVISRWWTSPTASQSRHRQLALFGQSPASTALFGPSQPLAGVRSAVSRCAGHEVMVDRCTQRRVTTVQGRQVSDEPLGDYCELDVRCSTVRGGIFRRNDLAEPTPWVSVWDVSNVVYFETVLTEPTPRPRRRGQAVREVLARFSLSCHL